MLICIWPQGLFFLFSGNCGNRLKNPDVFGELGIELGNFHTFILGFSALKPSLSFESVNGIPLVLL